jgi:hypothetical protein
VRASFKKFIDRTDHLIPGRRQRLHDEYRCVAK